MVSSRLNTHASSTSVKAPRVPGNSHRRKPSILLVLPVADAANARVDGMPAGGAIGRGFKLGLVL